MFVYFIRSGKKGAIKIGTARNVERRLATLQTGNQFELTLIAAIPCKSGRHAKWLEKRLHNCFSRQKIRGEWFQGNIDINRVKDDFIMIEDDELSDSESVNQTLDSEFASIIG